MRVSTYICTCKVRDGIMCPVRLCLDPLRHHLPWSLDPGWGPARSSLCIPIPCPLHPALGFQICGIMPSFLCGHYYQLSHLYSPHFYSLSVCCTFVVSMYVVHTHKCACAHACALAQVGIRVWQRMTNIFLYCSQAYCLEAKSFAEPEAYNSSKVVWPMSSGVPPSPSPRGVQQSCLNQVTGTCGHGQISCECCELESSCLHTEHFYLLCCLPSTDFMFLKCKLDYSDTFLKSIQWLSFTL